MSMKIALLDEPNSVVAESYRRLTTNLQYALLDLNHKIIQVTNARKDEGRSFVAANLAVSLAAGGHSVVLVDCDLRNPSQHEIFELNNDLGLTNVVFQGDEIEDVRKELKKAYGLSIIASGETTPLPAEIISSKKMEDMLEELRNAYEYIILDTPPTLAAPESVVLAGKVDGILMVIRASKTRQKDVNRTIEAIKQVNGNIIGTIFSNVDMSSFSFGK